MKILITGGCGFIGSNAARAFLEEGHTVTLYDDLSRPGTDRNLEWLKTLPRQNALTFVKGDVRDAQQVKHTMRDGRFDAVVHLAAQVAVTTSVTDPRRDFEINATGTFNVLEAVRLFAKDAVVVNASTNKVYGKLSALKPVARRKRYAAPNGFRGVSESSQLDFYSPYGCSKGAADQYTVDYARIFGLRTVNLRQSCIYGYRQFGVEDQGWVAWFAIAHMLGRPITLYGTGKQVRDLLFIDDLITCYIACIKRIDEVSGATFNIGGGPDNTLSLLELMDMLKELTGSPVDYKFAEPRPGDQPLFVADIRKAAKELRWRPRVAPREGVELLSKWLTANKQLFSGLPSAL